MPNDSVGSKNSHNSQADNKPIWKPFIVIALCAVVGLGIIWLLCLKYILLEVNRIPAFLGFTVNYLILMAMLVQAYIYREQQKAMQTGLEQNKRLIKIASDAFEIGEAPHFGIPQIQWIDNGSADIAELQISYLNGGKTPAWHFQTTATLQVRSANGSVTVLKCSMKPSNMRVSFVPGNIEIAIVYIIETVRRLSELRTIFIKDPDARLDVLAVILYQDFRGEWQSREFWATGGRGIGEDFEDRTATKQQADYQKILNEKTERAITKALKDRPKAN